jgi:hypothetical protein
VSTETERLWRAEVHALQERLDEAIAWVYDPGNWSAWDSRPKILLKILRGEL